LASLGSKAHLGFTNVSFLRTSTGDGTIATSALAEKLFVSWLAIHQFLWLLNRDPESINLNVFLNTTDDSNN